MLKLKSISNVESIKNESDFYAKIKIGFSNWHRSRQQLCYWSTGGGPQKSLLEVRLIKNSGAICAFTVVTMPKVFNQEILHIEKDVVEKIGLPFFDINLWQENGYCMKERESWAKDFLVFSGKNNTTISFSLNEITLKIFNGPVVFGFDKDNFLCFIQMVGMKFNKDGFLE